MKARTALLVAFLSMVSAALFAQDEGSQPERRPGPPVAASSANGFEVLFGGAWQSNEEAAGWGSTHYSIAGTLDIGMFAEYVYNRFPAIDSQQLDVGISYRVVPLQQADGVPIDLTIAGRYGFANFWSDYLEDNRLKRSGRGYSLTLLFDRRLPGNRDRAMMLGAVLDFSSYLYSSELTFTYDPDSFSGNLDIDPAEYPQEERFIDMKAGVRFGLIRGAEDGSERSITVAALTNQDLHIIVESSFSVFSAR